ncbi:hypothetical protein BH09VER1_BH09VER1_40200 [soil metagenome]
MKNFYQFSFYVSFVLLLSSFIFPATSGIPIETRLLRTDQWELKFNSPDHLLMGADEEFSKTKLIEFLRHYHSIYAYGIAWLSAALLVATLFSLVGWRRENYLERRATQNTTPPISSP